MPKPGRLAAPLPASTDAAETTTAAVNALTPPTHTPKYKRLTDAQRIAILKMARLNKTQVEIAQFVGCDQSAVSRWIQANEDSTAEAISYVKGSALSMAMDVVQYGKAADKVNVLKGIGVLQDQQNVGLSIHIGGNNTDVKILTLSSRNESDASS